MGFLGTLAGTAVDLTLVIQIIVLFILLLGYKFKMNMKFRNHGITMSVAVLLHLISIFTIMIPSMINFSNLLITEIASIPIILTWIHAILGVLSIIIGIFLVAEWRFRAPPNMTCIKRKPLMKPLIIMWVSGLILGIIIYIYAYVPF
jgi:membrane-associated HD superfamily phosphohydrolase